LPPEEVARELLDVLLLDDTMIVYERTYCCSRHDIELDYTNAAPCLEELLLYVWFPLSQREAGFDYISGKLVLIIWKFIDPSHIQTMVATVHKCLF
jgi:hypothetical protein